MSVITEYVQNVYAVILIRKVSIIKHTLLYHISNVLLENKALKLSLLSRGCLM